MFCYDIILSCKLDIIRVEYKYTELKGNKIRINDERARARDLTRTQREFLSEQKAI